MDDKNDLMARTMVESLSIGINHLTGKRFHRRIAAPTRWYKRR